MLLLQRSALLFLVVLVSRGGVAAEPVPVPYRDGFEAITGRELKAWLCFLASPELEGREAGARGYDLAARYVASVLESLGVEPLGDGGTYFQGFDLLQRGMDLDGASLAIEPAEPGQAGFPLRGHVAAESGRDIEWKEPWLFAGHGEGAAADAPDDFHGLSLEGKVVLVLPRDGARSGAARGALLAGARRIAVISDEQVKRRGGGHSPEVPAPRGGGGAEPGPPAAEVIYLSRAAANRLLRAKGTSVEAILAGPGRPAPFQLDGIDVRLTIKSRESRKPTMNVVGIIRGSDPALREEVVAIGAHLDHVGGSGGKVFPGADDDASGTSAVLGAARAFTSNPVRPRRSILLLFFSAEEKGLLGSRYFVEHCPVPLERIVLELQLDMVGRNEEVRSSDPGKAEKPEDNIDSIHIVGSREHSLELDPWVNAVNAHVGMKFEYDEERVYRRSDQYEFGRRGVPVIFFFGGFHPDYHQPTDTADRINYEKVLNVSRLVFSTAFEVADRPRRLEVNRY